MTQSDGNDLTRQKPSHPRCRGMGKAKSAGNPGAQVDLSPLPPDQDPELINIRRIRTNDARRVPVRLDAFIRHDAGESSQRRDAGVLTRVYTDLCVLDVTSKGFKLIDPAEGNSLEEVQGVAEAHILA